MGRAKGKGKKQPVVAAREEFGSEEENKLLASKRRGRPQKPLKDEVEEFDEVGKIEDDIDDGNPKSSITSKSSNDENAVEDGMKRRKRSSQVTANSDPVMKENVSEAKPRTEDSVKPVGFRQIGSRRKSKPRRAAEAGVACN